MALPSCSNAAEFLVTLRAAGFTLVPRGEFLEVRPASKLTDDLRQVIRTHKAELLRLLAAEAEAIDLVWEGDGFDERSQSE